MVDAHQRHVQRLGERARGGADGSQTRTEAGAAREGDRVDGAVSLFESGLDHFGNRLAHVLGGLARVNAAALGLVGVGFDKNAVRSEF